MQIKANADCNCWYRERHKTQRAFGLRKKGTQVQTARARQEIVFETIKLEMKALRFYLIWSKRLERRGEKKITSYRCRVAFNYFTHNMGPADLIQIWIWRKNKEVKSLQLCRHCLHRSLLQALQRATGTCFKARKPLEANTQPSPRAQASSLQWRAEERAPVKSQKIDSECNSYLNKSLMTPCSSALTVG